MGAHAADIDVQAIFPGNLPLLGQKGAAGDLVSMTDVYRGIIPFVLLQLAVMAVLIW